MLVKPECEHVADQVAAHPGTSCVGSHHNVTDRTESFFPAVEIGERDHTSRDFNDRCVRSLFNAPPYLGCRQREGRLREAIKKLFQCFRAIENLKHVVFSCFSVLHGCSLGAKKGRIDLFWELSVRAAPARRPAMGSLKNESAPVFPFFHDAIVRRR